jgi:hypothetical protein
MRDFKVRKTIILTLLVVLLTADAALVYFISRASSRAQDPEATLKAQTLQLSLMKEDVDRARKIRARTPEVEKYFDQFETTLPPQGKGYSVLSMELDEIARDTHVQVKDKKFRQKEISGRNVDEIEIDATLDGDYGGIVRFLNRLQRSKNTYVVDSLGLDSEKATGGQGAQPSPGAVKVSLRVRSYFRKA